MFRFLKESLICPECHGELVWNITDENDVHIVEAEIKCYDCVKRYAVKNGVGCFIEYENNSDDNWQHFENQIKGFIDAYPEIKEKLMTTDIEAMNAADIMVRSMINKVEGDTAESERLYAIWRQKAYREETIKARQAQIEHIVNALQYLTGQKDFILDVASGSGTLVKELLKKTNALIISSDISFNAMEAAKKLAEKDGFGDRVSYIAFDLNKSPFKNNSVKTITTYYGLQNIPYPENIFKEIRRICNGKLYSVCSFCCEDNIVNLEALEDAGLSKTCVKNKYIEEFNNAGFNSVAENSIITLDEPTPIGEIAQGVGIDGFPIEAGHFEHVTVISS